MAPGAYPRIFVAVAWPYANGPLHLGHVAGSLLPPDIFARYHRLAGHDVLMVSGSDMHGTPITVRAEREGVAPEALAKRMNEEHKRALAALSIQFDLFTSTATENHREVVQDLFTTLHRRGDVYAKTMTAPYDPKAKRFLPDRYVEGTCPHCGFADARGDQCDNCGRTLDPHELKDPRSKLSGAAPEYRETEHFFLRLSTYQDRLARWSKRQADAGRWRPNTRNFTENWLKEGLKDRPITRDLLYGVPIPLEGYDDKRIYVWFEAVVGYLSASIEWAKKHHDAEAWKKFWLPQRDEVERGETRHFYFMGKDNVPFHTIIWPAMLMGYSDGKGERYHLPYDVPANEFMNFQGTKLSKSRGNLVEVQEVVPRFDADAVRYYLTSNMPETRDSNWAWDEFAARVNDELVGTYGNLVNRVLTFTKKNFETVPESGALTAASEELIEKIAATHAEVTRALEAVELRRALKEVMALAQAGNKFVDDRAPWKLAKSDPVAFAECQHVSLRLVRALAVLSAPFLPNASASVWRQLGEPHALEKVGWGAALDDIRAGQKLGEVRPLFQKLDPKDVVPRAPAPKETPKMETAPPKPTVTYDEFAKLDLRVGVVTSVEPHPKADKLYVLKVDLGTEERQILAGLREHVKVEELLGKSVIVIANLAPREIRGLMSEGMLLAAEGGGVVAPLTPARVVPPGSGIK